MQPPALDLVAKMTTTATAIRTHRLPARKLQPSSLPSTISGSVGLADDLAQIQRGERVGTTGASGAVKANVPARRPRRARSERT